MSQSGRQRVPQTGRSNLGMESARGGGEGGSGSSRRGSSNSLTSEQQRELNDPALVLRPFSAEARVLDAHKKRPPVLPKSRFRAVPDLDPTLGVPSRGRGRHALPLCPDGWVQKNLEPNWFETLDQGSALFDIEAKTMICRDFVERNRHDLWKYNLNYLGKTPRTVADELAEHPSFVKTFQQYNDRERKLRLSNSNQLKAALRDDHLNSLGEVKTDHFLQSHDTPREARSLKMTYLLQSAQVDGSKRRGYKFDREWGNFSTYNGNLAANKGAMLER